jgi:predicted PurR-regulated permease PerM
MGETVVIAVTERTSIVEAAPEPRPEPPSLPRDARSVMLAGLFVLAVFYTLYVTSEIVVPLILAILLKLLLQPGLRMLVRARVPQAVAALMLIVALCGVLGALGYGLSGPASSWISKAPQSLPRMEQRLSVLRQPIDRLLNVTHRVEQIAEAPGRAPTQVIVQGTSLGEYLFTGTRSVLTGFGITLLLLFFLLASGDLFMRKLVEILPTFGDKKQAVQMSRDIEESISGYLVTISVMNALVGVATALAMYVIGLPDPLLWGAVAFILNYVLILGPLTGLAIFFCAGLLHFDTLWQGLLPPAAYLIIHIIEGEAVTPWLVARRFTLNPVLVVASLIFWDWMWGIPGALLAVPMLATFKIVCERVRPLMAVGHFIGG